MDNPLYNLNDLLLIMTVLECALLALIILMNDQTRRKSIAILSAFLFVFAFDALSTLLIWHQSLASDSWLRQSLHTYFYVAGQCLMGPLLYLYVRSILQKTELIKRQALWHAFPALIAITVVGIFSLTMNDMKFFDTRPEVESVRLYLWYFMKLIPLCYGAAAAYSILNYRFQLREQYSHYHPSDIVWLWGLTLGFMMLWSWTALIILVSHFIGGKNANLIGTGYNYLTFILVNALFYFSLLSTRHIQKVQINNAPFKPEIPESTKPIIDIINDGIQRQKIHLEPNLNIDDFSKRIGIPTKVVSATINREMNTKFFEFINTHRIEHAKNLLAEPKHKKSTILDILLMSGFNNKSSFHRFFKRMVGIPPTEYRKNALSDMQVDDPN